MVKRRLADAALMEIRLNERKQQNEHKSEKICGQQDYTAPAPECVPEKAFLWTYRGNVYPKTGFWVHMGIAGRLVVKRRERAPAKARFRWISVTGKL